MTAQPYEGPDPRMPYVPYDEDEVARRLPAAVCLEFRSRMKQARATDSGPSADEVLAGYRVEAYRLAQPGHEQRLAQAAAGQGHFHPLPELVPEA